MMMASPAEWKPNGWLGMLLGTSLWYGFYGLDDEVQTLSRSLSHQSRAYYYQQHDNLNAFVLKRVTARGDIIAR